MSLNINGVDIFTGTIIQPLVGVWTADLVIDRPDGTGFDAGTTVTIQADNGYVLKGTVAKDRTGDFLDAVHVRVLGGAGGMSNACVPRSYAQPSAFAKDVVNGLVSDAGETLSALTDAGFLNTNLVAWATKVMPVSQALKVLLKLIAPTMSWRVLPDGTLWIGQETWPESDVIFDVLMQNPSEGEYTLGVDMPFISAGMSLAGVGQVNRVEHEITAGHVRSHVLVSMPMERGLRAAIAGIVRQETSSTDYFALYQAKVVTQSADLTTVDIQPVTPNLPGMGRVPVRLGPSMVKCQFTQGATVMLGWDGGSPDAPYVCLGSSADSVQSIQLAGNIPVARKGDGAGGGSMVVAFVPGSGAAALTITYTPGDGSSPQVLSGAGGTLNILEHITSGSSVVGAG